MVLPGGGRYKGMSIINFFKRKTRNQEFKDTYEKYYNMVFKRISYLTGDAHAAEDLTQEAFIKLYNYPPEHGNTAAWLNKVSANLSYNYLRDEKVHGEKNEAVFDREYDNVISIEDAAIKNCEIALTKKALNTLVPRDRMCLLLKFSGYKYSEIAEIIGVDKNSVGTILSRAQAKFKEAYLNLEKWGEKKYEVSR